MPRSLTLVVALVLAALCSCRSATRPTGPVQFVDVTHEAGIRFTHNNGAFGHKYLPETMGSGVCVFDYDNDGWQDVLFVNGTGWPGHPGRQTTAALYRNNHDGTFTDVTKGSGLDVPLYGMGCAAADFDNDGNEDVYITAVGTSHLFRNQGNGRFQDVTGTAGVASPGFATGAIWFDYDNDGKLDLYVAHYVAWSAAADQPCSLDGTHKSYCTPELYKGESATLYRNLGNGRFEDATRKAGMYDATSKSLGVAMLDYDDDGCIDLLVTNDTQPNKLYHNNKNGTFTDAGFEAGVALSDAGRARAGMGVDVADYDRSGRSGVLIGNFSGESLALYRNEGAGLFAESSAGAGLAGASASALTFGTFFFDYDLDGLPDIFAANGHVADDVSVTQPMLLYAEPALLFHNMGGGHFANVSTTSGAALTEPVVARGAAFLDYDNDGDLDLLETTSGGAARLLQNQNGNRNDALCIRTVGVASNRDGIGAKITVTKADGQKLQAMTKDGSSYLSQSQLPVTFGLGKPAAGAVTVDVRWPSGHRDSLQQVAPDQCITILEGKGILAARPFELSGKR